MTSAAFGPVGPWVSVVGVVGWPARPPSLEGKMGMMLEIFAAAVRDALA